MLATSIQPRLNSNKKPKQHLSQSSAQLFKPLPGLSSIKTNIIVLLVLASVTLSFSSLTVLAQPVNQQKPPIQPKSNTSEQTIYLSTLEWPPYSSQQLPDGGAAVFIAKAAFSAMGYQLKVDFYPWARTIDATRSNNSRYSGYFPEYYSSQTAQKFIYSDAMFNSPLGLIEHKDHPIRWQEVTDLNPYVIGTVRNYINTEEFDQRVAAGQQLIEAVTDDKTNIKKVAAYRIPAAIMDLYVFSYLVNNDPKLRSAKYLLQANKQLLESKALYICFKDTPKGQHFANIYNQGLEKVDVERLLADYMSRLIPGDTENLKYSISQ